MATAREHASAVRDKFKVHARNAANSVIDNAVPELRHAFREVGDKQLLRANVRSTVGSAASSFVKDRATQARRQGNYLLQAAFMLAHKYVSGYQERTSQEQRLFENTARVRRGDTKDLSHADLRAVADHAERYAGTGLHDKEHLKAAAESELENREKVRTREKTRIRQRDIIGDAHVRRAANAHVAEGRRDERALTHQQKLQNIREKAQVKVQAKQEAKAAIPARPRVAPGPTAQVFHGKKAGTIYTKDSKGNKHYITHRVAPRGGRPAPRMPRR